MATQIGEQEVKTYKEAGLGIPFRKLVIERQGYKERMDEGERALGDKKKDDPGHPGLNARIESALQARGLSAVIVDDWIVTRSSGKNVTIPREKLAQAMIEAGIDGDVIEAVIAAAQNENKYTYIQVTRAKKLIERSEEQGFEPLPKVKESKPRLPVKKTLVKRAVRR